MSTIDRAVGEGGRQVLRSSVAGAIRALGRIALACALGYAIVAAISMLLEEHMIYFPERGGRVAGPGSDVSLRTEDGVELHARFVERPGARFTLLYLHGNAGNLAGRSSIIQQLSRLDANLLALDYRGYGQSEGTPSEAGLYLDASAAHAWVAARTRATKLIVLGESLGGGPACELAATREIAGLVLLSTFTNIPDMAALSFGWLPVRWLVRTRFDNLSKLARIRSPLLIIHSRRDEIVPFTMGERLLAAAREPKQRLWLEQPGHNETFALEAERVLRTMDDFMRDLSGREP